jgi:hypothetical protein
MFLQIFLEKFVFFEKKSGNSRKTRLKILPVLTHEPYTSLLHFLLNKARPGGADQGDIVGREYIISSKFMPPYGILLADSTISVARKI